MKIKQLFLMAAFGLMATASLTSCEDILGEWSKPAPATVTPAASVAVTSITLSATEATINVGATEALAVTAVTPDNATDKTVTWSSSDEAVATVADGVVTAVAAGTATITATANDGSGVKATCEVTVKIPGLLAGKFTINASDDQVQFSQGNLQATYDGSAWTWAFAENQWDYVGNAAGNTSIDGNGTVSASNVTVDLFGWVGESSATLTTDPAKYGISNSTTSSIYGTSTSDVLKSDWGTNMGTGWRSLTSAEWTYLFNTRTTGGTVFCTASARYAHATINTDGTSVNGMILFPDGVDIANSEVTTAGSVNANSAWVTQCTSAQWTALAAKGCVFLPAAGYRNGSTVYSAGSYGCYWSSSPYGSNADVAYDVNFLSGYLDPAGGYYRYYGFSVRLVRPAE